VTLGRLTELQVRILRDLAVVRPRWTLTGGGALAGIYTKHRSTRDLDLFWRGAGLLGELPRDVTSVLESDRLDVEPVQITPAFCRLRVTGGGETVLVDLVADAAPIVEEPREEALQDVTILVDTQHEILVSKLCSLLERSEPRDLEDVRVLVQGGGDLERAVSQAPSKDAGFSPLTLAWLLRDLPISSLAAASGWTPDEIVRLESFRDDLVRSILGLTTQQ
jgi:hypothetical protein